MAAFWSPCQHHLERLAFGLHHALGEPADDLQACSVDIHQPEFCDGQCAHALEEPVDQLRGVRRPSTDDARFS